MGKTAFCLNIATNAAAEGHGRGDLLAGNVEGGAGAAHALRRGAGGQPAGSPGHAARLGLHPARARGGHPADLPALDRRHARAHAAGDALARRGGSRSTTTSGWSWWTTCSSCGAPSTPRTGSRKSPTSPARSRRWRGSWTSRSSRCRSSRRASEQRGGERKPILSDLRDSGAIEQDADLVIFIHRPEYYDREDETQARAWPRSCWPSTATARRATCSSTSSGSSPASTT